MFSRNLLVSALAHGAIANPVLRRDDTQPVGDNPIVNFSAEYLGTQKASNSCSHRDLGFTGELQGTYYANWGDVLWCDAGVTDPAQDTDGFHGMVRDAVSRTTDDPLVVEDLNLNSDSPVAHQQQFVPYNEAWGETNQYGFGGTSMSETYDGMGVVYILVNANDDGLKGAGAVKVELVNDAPVVTSRLGDQGWWWDVTNLPRYGDVAAFRDPQSDYIYLWGGAPTKYTGTDASYVYLARVNAADAYDLTKYEYFWGRSQGWKADALTEHSTDTAVWWNSGQGQIVWSDKFECYIFVHLGPGGSDVLLRTATSLEGPWTPDVTVYTAAPIDGGMTYAGVAHPYLDTTGGTLTVSWTNSNTIDVLKITFT